MSDKPLIEHYFHQVQYKDCQFTFSNVLLWSRFYKTKFAVIEDMLVFCQGEEYGRKAFIFPIGSGDPKPVIDRLMQECEKCGHDFCMYLVNREMFEKLDALYPNKFTFEPNRDLADYIYNRDDLQHLTGKKYQPKRNHINRFKQNNPDWCYEALTPQNAPDCLAMAKEWAEQNNAAQGGEEDKINEMWVVEQELTNLEQLGLQGGLIRAGGKVVAFTIGEGVCDDTYVSHVEKAFAEIQGSYAIINQQLAEHLPPQYRYINREEDMGEENLRKAKQSYHPAILLEKGFAVIK